MQYPSRTTPDETLLEGRRFVSPFFTRTSFHRSASGPIQRQDSWDRPQAFVVDWLFPAAKSAADIAAIQQKVRRIAAGNGVDDLPRR